MTITLAITLTFDDVRWHTADAHQAMREAAQQLATTASYHPGATVVFHPQGERVHASSNGED